MPTKKKVEVLEEVSAEVALWKKEKLQECIMEFSCGGDSMNDYSFRFFDKRNKEVVCDELKNFFDDEVFKKVEFYVNSDGHYQGEFGEVIITLNDDNEFEYQKSAKSEWSERLSETTCIGITPEEMAFLKEKVSNMNGGDGERNINYKIDCVLTDEEEEMAEKLLERIDEMCCEHEFNNEEGQAEDFYTWTTNEHEDVLEFETGSILVVVSRNFSVIKEGESY